MNIHTRLKIFIGIYFFILIVAAPVIINKKISKELYRYDSGTRDLQGNKVYLEWKK